ncbi:hypothetical protein BKA01_008030 [Pseudonocardia eucalypti]|uniref:ESX secretion-associated protein EspG n=1 Tax=Pseudonocardia eucalypti TaxID=648755 RepID=UPI0016101006|nr:hypothetical protein [Pseudonocardia eucalypti]MBB6380753.1 hypothetical protein [Pseudonocardia eucalypti]
MATTGRAVQLSPVELLACWEALQLGELPCELHMRRPSGPWAAQQATRQVLARALIGLAVRGLSDGTRPTADLAEMLQPLAHPSYQLDIRFTGPNRRPIVGLGPVTNTHSLVVTFIDDGESPIELRATDSSQIPGVLLALLGPFTPGISPPVNLPADLFDQACETIGDDAGPWALADQLREHGAPRRDAEALARMWTDIDFGGQLGVTAWRDGREHRCPWVIGFLRNLTGQTFLHLRRAGTLTMCPIDAPGLHRHWRELLTRTTTGS